MSGSYPPSRGGRGTSRGRGAWGRGGDSDSGPVLSTTRPYKRPAVGRGFAQPRNAVGASSKRPRTSHEGAGREKTKASREVLARVAAIRESASQFVGGDAPQESSSDGEEEEEEGREVLKTVLKMYYQDLGADGGEEVGGELLQSVVIAAAGSCLVCLSSIKRADAVWSCVQCYCLFHLQCIQQWARDGERRLSLLSPELFPGQELCWSCPKCRLDFPTSQFPKTYICFCGKQIDPPVDPWLLPHSCGEMCDKPLQPECGHRCVSLCHPGPCLPCPKTISVTCHCGRSVPVVKRCGVRGWTCGRVCGKELACGMHTCEQRCHEGACGECGEVIEQACVCGRESRLLPCEAPSWQCSQPCGRLLTCGCHNCDQVCHSGPCGDCPRSGTRTCPCGKTEHNLPCTDEVPTCRDTCNKDLLCGRHKCMRPCHYGSCGLCLQMAVKSCRCGKREKEVPCNSEYLCDAKCPVMRQCGRHQCKRKCCDGRCPPCEQVCGRSLGCRNHKCAAPCHSGRCYPCILTAEINCACKATTITVPCGREKITKPPKCREMCRKPSACHHPETMPHYCHYGPCPACKQLCGRDLPCGHRCQAVCHSVPQIPKVRPPGVAPWVKIEPVVIPCPPCATPLSIACKGEHEVSQQLCSAVREYSCGRQCSRLLACGNHSCQRDCHVVINPPDSKMAGEDCLECTRGCEVPRPHGCTHPCSRPCHTGECEVCEVLVKLRCHCDTMNLFVKCCEWSAASGDKKTELQTCTSQCTKLLPCGHRCPRQCHPGSCPSPEKCRRKVTLRCSCRRIKKELRCNEREEKTPVCDAECEKIIAQREEEERKERERKQEAEQREREEEEAAALRQLQPRRRRRRPRKTEIEEEEPGFYQRHRSLVLIVGGAVGVVSLALLGYGLVT